MTRNQPLKLGLILLVLIVAIWISLSDRILITNPFNGAVLIDRNIAPHLGLDLRGGLQVLMEADLPATTKIEAGSMETARTILANRTNALGVAETTLQLAGERRIVGEFPGAEDPEAVIASLKQTGLLEFVDTGDQSLPVGTTILTDFGLEPGFVATPDPAATPGPDGTIPAPTVYHTVMTGKDLKTAAVSPLQGSGYQIAFTLSSAGSKIFADYTTNNVQKYLTIVLDKKVISSPQIQNPILDGSGVITGSFTLDEANNFVVQLRYGSLPIPIKVVESRAVGPTLGAESVRKSVTAGAIGLIVVMLFMAFYYRLPGIIADLALITYALISYALFKSIPVTLTLPGIAGFILSIGMAVDANVLIFERLKEELRSGKTLLQAIDLGWSRAWTSIRDSNISTLITCVILYIFGSAFGASIVKGFSVTLALGVLVSLFTAITVTRSYLHLVLDNAKAAEHPRWFGM